MTTTAFFLVDGIYSSQGVLIPSKSTLSVKCKDALNISLEQIKNGKVIKSMVKFKMCVITKYVLIDLVTS